MGFLAGSLILRWATVNYSLYDSIIHGHYDPAAVDAAAAQAAGQAASATQAVPPSSELAALHVVTGRFNPGRVNDRHKSWRQVNTFFDVDAATNSHDGRSSNAERQGKKLTK
ncbi:hypothetical protein H2201_009184 [Coniosporium apollinis]|uniref:Uncharacterized protein n=1 Tax=Coniosporium apollinis TaxID=61459 RepID=A0ABQ9NH13_9PEZI|nr:hypothetical protein H2201_009184 [Coniosporium apollinis]